MPFSLMNGLAGLGQGISQAALEGQKALLAQQQLRLANELTTAREMGLQTSQQAFQAGQTEKQQAFQTGLQTSQQTFQAGQTAKEIAAKAALQQSQQTFEAAQQQRQFHAPTETERLFDFLGINADGTPKAPGAAPAAGPVVSPVSGAATTTATATAPTPTTATPPASPASGDATTLSATGTSAADASNRMPDFAKAMIAKATTGVLPGSEQADRFAIRQGVARDPDFKYKPDDEQAIESERRFAVATAKMADPVTRHALATAIGGYQLPPMQLNRANPGSMETMAEVMQLNPAYNAEQYTVMNDVMKKFAGGPDGDKIRFLDVGVQHLSVLEDAAKALQNNNLGPINQLKNYFSTEFGAAPPNTFDALKGLVGKEVQKAVAGNLGSAGERADLEKTLSNARSPEQLFGPGGVLSALRQLMVGQLTGLKQQYNAATLNQFREGSPFAFENKLLPETKAALRPGAIPPPTTTTAPPPVTPPVRQGAGYIYGDLPAPPPSPPNPALLRLWGQ